MSKIEILDDQSFIEYSLKGFPARFTITAREDLHVKNPAMELIARFFMPVKKTQET